MISFSKLGQYGKFGNQMFQYVFLRTMAQRLDVKFYCPYWEGDSVFDLNDQEEKIECVDQIVNNFCQVKEDCGYQKEAMQISDGTEICGYFQSEKYFDSKIKVRSWFTFNEDIRKIKDQFSFIDFSQSVSVSLRMGDDYGQRRDLYPLYPLVYYQKALKLVQQKKHVLIFSDRPDRAEDFFKKIKKKHNMIFIKNPNDCQQMYLISLCHDNIITNSTFSWWGAWLNHYEDKTVIAPQEWFRPGCGLKISDINCQSWVSLCALSPIIDHYSVWNLKNRFKRKSRHLLQKFR